MSYKIIPVKYTDGDISPIKLYVLEYRHIENYPGVIVTKTWRDDFNKIGTPYRLYSDKVWNALEDVETIPGYHEEGEKE